MLYKWYIYKCLLGLITVNIVLQLVINSTAIKFKVGASIGHTGVIAVVN